MNSMGDELQEILLHNYIDGWKENKNGKVLSALSEDCVIIESHGPTYQGSKIVNQWFDEWHRLGNKVEKWEISSLYSVEGVIFCEWVFAYSGPHRRESFKGITVAKFKDSKIFELREYRMTANPFIWQPSKNTL